MKCLLDTLYVMKYVSKYLFCASAIPEDVRSFRTGRNGGEEAVGIFTPAEGAG